MHLPIFRVVAVAVTLLLAGAGSAHAQRRGSGSGESSATPPPVKDAGGTPAPEQGSRQAPMAARMRDADRMPTPGGQSYETWKSGDLVRSDSSADVRSARRQQAPDLEWAGGEPKRR